MVLASDKGLISHFSLAGDKVMALAGMLAEVDGSSTMTGSSKLLFIVRASGNLIFGSDMDHKQFYQTGTSLGCKIL